MSNGPRVKYESYQHRVSRWMYECFGDGISYDRKERGFRFLEEALELGQAIGMSATEAHQLVDYVYGRETGEIQQEVGGVMVTLAALASACRLNLENCGEAELERCWDNIAKIRAKHQDKVLRTPHSPLPGNPS